MNPDEIDQRAMDEMLRKVYKLHETGRDDSDQWKEIDRERGKRKRLFTCDYCGGDHDESECPLTDPQKEALMQADWERVQASKQRPSTPADWEAEADQVVTLASAKVSEQGARRLRAELALAKSQVEAGHLTGQDALARIMASTEDVIAKSPK